MGGFLFPFSLNYGDKPPTILPSNLEDTIYCYIPRPGYKCKYRIQFSNISSYKDITNIASNKSIEYGQNNTISTFFDGFISFKDYSMPLNSKRVLAMFSNLVLSFTYNGNINIKESSIYLSDLQAPSLWEFRNDGSLKTIWRDTIRSTIGNNILRLVASTVQVVIKTKQLAVGEKWSTMELNLNGTNSINYYVISTKFSEVKNRAKNVWFEIRKVPASNDELDAIETSQTKRIKGHTYSSGEILIVYDSLNKQIIKLHGVINDSLKLGIFNIGNSQSEFELALIENSKIKPNSFTSEQRFNYELPIIPEMNAIDQRSNDERFLKGITINQLLLDLRKADLRSDPSERANLHSKILSFLRLSPQSSDSIAVILKKNLPTCYSYRIVMSAFLVSGLEEAQKHLIELFTSNYYTKEQRLVILIKSAEVKHPSDILLNTIESLSRGKDSVYALSANIVLARLLPELVKTDNQKTNSLLSSLYIRSTDLINRFGLSNFIKMIPVTNSAYLAPLVQKTYIKSNSVEKEEIIKILSKIKGSVPDSLLINIAKLDPESSIRQNALIALDNHDLLENAVISVNNIAKNDESYNVRIQASQIVKKYETRYKITH